MLEQPQHNKTNIPLKPQAKSVLDEDLIHSIYSNLDLIFQNRIVTKIVTCLKQLKIL